MTTKLLLSGILIVACMSSCSDSDSPHDWSDYFVQCMVNTWMDNYTDGCGGGDRMYFKPLDETNMLMWRVRNRLELFDDGTATYTLASQEDPRWTGSVQAVSGSWTFNTDTMTLLILGVDGQILYSFLVEHVGKDFLFIRYNEMTSTPAPK